MTSNETAHDRTDSPADEQSETAPQRANLPEAAQRADLPEAAQRALAEADARRKATQDPDLPREVGGRDGPEPVRYGDWEKKGIAIDF